MSELPDPNFDEIVAPLISPDASVKERITKAASALVGVVEAQAALDQQQRQLNQDINDSRDSDSANAQLEPTHQARLEAERRLAAAADTVGKTYSLKQRQVNRAIRLAREMLR